MREEFQLNLPVPFIFKEYNNFFISIQCFELYLLYRILHGCVIKDIKCSIEKRLNAVGIDINNSDIELNQEHLIYLEAYETYTHDGTSLNNIYYPTFTSLTFSHENFKIILITHQQLENMLDLRETALIREKQSQIDRLAPNLQEQIAIINNRISDTDKIIQEKQDNLKDENKKENELNTEFQQLSEYRIDANNELSTSYKISGIPISAATAVPILPIIIICSFLFFLFHFTRLSEILKNQKEILNNVTWFMLYKEFISQSFSWITAFFPLASSLLILLLTLLFFDNLVNNRLQFPYIYPLTHILHYIINVISCIILLSLGINTLIKRHKILNIK